MKFSGAFVWAVSDNPSDRGVLLLPFFATMAAVSTPIDANKLVPVTLGYWRCRCVRMTDGRYFAQWG